MGFLTWISQSSEDYPLAISLHPEARVDIDPPELPHAVHPKPTVAVYREPTIAASPEPIRAGSPEPTRAVPLEPTRTAPPEPTRVVSPEPGVLAASPGFLRRLWNGNSWYELRIYPLLTLHVNSLSDRLRRCKVNGPPVPLT